MESHYEHVAGAVFNCNSCPTRCDGVSKGVYNFKSDVAFSEEYENRIIAWINHEGKFSAYKSGEDGYPDITITKKDNGSIVQFLEIKVQRRTFMTVEKTLPKSLLRPSETLALNLSDLLRYFEIQKETRVPTSILWVLTNRPCMVDDDATKFYYQSAEILEKIYSDQGNKRRFRRKSGKGDVVDGEHKGVVVNYHFSIDELKEWKSLNV